MKEIFTLKHLSTELSIVRVLDKIYGTKEDLKLLVGSQIKYGSITLDLKSCFYKNQILLKML